MNYEIGKKVHGSFSETIKAVSEELKKEGFAVISEIDLKEKLNVDFRPHKESGKLQAGMDRL